MNAEEAKAMEVVKRCGDLFGDEPWYIGTGITADSEGRIKAAVCVLPGTKLQLPDSLLGVPVIVRFMPMPVACVE